MSVSHVLEQLRLSRARTVSAVGLAAVTGAATLALGLSPDPEQPTASTTELVSLSAPSTGVSLQQGSLREQSATAYQRAQTDIIEAERKAAAERAAKAKRQVEAERRAEQDRQKAARQQAARQQAARQKAETQRVAAEKQTVSRAATRAERPAASYPDNLDGWIREAMAIMEREGIPGTYHGIHRNIMRESSGNPWAVNNWDINARNGVPSKGLLQVIQPTFDAYHVAGTARNLFDPVANIVAACNYAADRYGSIDNVYSAY